MRKPILLYWILAVSFGIFLGCEKNPVSFSLKTVSELSTEPKPNAIVVDDQLGVFYVANSNSSLENYSHRIQCFDLQGNYLRTIADFINNPKGNYRRYTPIDMVLDSDHHLHVLAKPYDQLADGSWAPFPGFCIIKYQADGSFQGEFDFARFEPYWSLGAIAFHRGYLFVTDGRVLMKIDKDNGLFFEIPLPSEPDSAARFITDMSVDSKGTIWLVEQAFYVDESIGCQFIRINLTENSLTKFYAKGKTKNYSSMLSNPGIAIDRDDYIYLATFYCRTLEIYKPNCEFLNQIELDDRTDCLPIDVAVDDKGRVYVADFGADRVLILKRN